MIPRIEILAEKKLIGQNLEMSVIEDRTGELWKGFMQNHQKINHRVNDDKISMQIYSSTYFKPFNPHEKFKKWAAVEVHRFDTVPEEMETFILDGGQYAVFTYRGLSTDKTIFQNIYSSWLPTSNYTLDDRPHFELLGEKYKNNDPHSEEEIWIPIK